jgi:hypothetical protein
VLGANILTKSFIVSTDLLLRGKNERHFASFEFAALKEKPTVSYMRE